MIKAILTNTAFNGVASAIGSISIIYVVSVLEPSAWGLSAAILGIGQFLGSALSFGSQVDRIKRYSRQDRKAAVTTARHDSVARVAVGVGFGSLAGIAITLDATTFGAILLAAAGVYVGLGTPNLRVSQKSFGQAGIRIVSEKVIALAIVLGIATAGLLGVATLPIAIGIAGLLVGFGDLIVLRTSLMDARVGLTRRVIARQWKGTFYYGIASLAPSLMLLDTIVVVAFSDSTQAGYLSVGSKLVSPLGIATSAMVAALLPYLSAESTRLLPRFRDARAIAALSAFGVAMGFIFWLADYWVPFLFGREYLTAVWPVRLYVLNVVVVLFTRIGVTMLQAWDEQKAAGIMVAAQCVAALLGIAIGAHFGGALGASFALVSTNIVLAGFLFARVRALAAATP